MHLQLEVGLSGVLPQEMTLLLLPMDGAGNEYSQNAPINDNEWHLLTTTFGNGSKKIYLDGEQIASASQSGSVSASSLKLLFGDPLQQAEHRLKSMMFAFTVAFFQPRRLLRFTMMDLEISESQNFKLPVLLPSQHPSIKIYLIKF